MPWCAGQQLEASQEALLQERLREAEEKVAHLNTMIAGPPTLEVKPACVQESPIQTLSFSLYKESGCVASMSVRRSSLEVPSFPQSGVSHPVLA